MNEKNKADISKLFHDIRNPLAYVTNNLATLLNYSQNFTQLLALNKALIHSNSSNLDELIPTIKELYIKCDFDFIGTDLENLASESLEGCKKIESLLHSLQEQLKSLG